jgi:zinc protease
MRKILYTLMAFSLLLTASGFAQQGGSKDANAILDKAIQATGGEAKLAKYKALSFKEKGTYYGMGKGMPYTAKYAMQYPGQFRMEIDGFFIKVLDHDKGWVRAEGKTKEMSKEELAVNQHEQKIGWLITLLPLRDKAVKLEVLDEAKVGNQATSVIRAKYSKDQGGIGAKLYFDKKTGLLAKLEYQSKSQEQKFKEVTTEVFYSDYKDVDGIFIAQKIVIKQDGKDYVEAEMIDLRAPEKLDSKVFARPDKD